MSINECGDEKIGQQALWIPKYFETVRDTSNCTLSSINPSSIFNMVQRRLRANYPYDNYRFVYVDELLAADQTIIDSLKLYMIMIGMQEAEKTALVNGYFYMEGGEFKIEQDCGMKEKP